MKSNYLTKALTLLLLLWAAGTNANNIQVTINSYDAALKRLNVTLSWDNSWHDGTGTFRDAAWVFIKYKDATMMTWETAPVSVPSPATWQATGNNVRFEALGKNPISTSTAADYRGLIIRRAKTAGLAISDPTMTGVYNVSMTFNIPFAFPGTPANPEFKIFALEMVDVPQGAFYAGDGSSYSYVKTSNTSDAPKAVANEAATSVYLFSGNVSVPATFPKGYNEFYTMKYELSQEGYIEFLNTLNRAQQNLVVDNAAFTSATGAVPTSSICASGIMSLYYSAGTSPFLIPYTVDSRQGITALCTGATNAAVFSCNINQNSTLNENADGQNLPVVPYSASSILYYLDWAGLSPMTPFEYEKACRGPVYPVSNEFAWGSTQTSLPPAADFDLNGPGEVHSGTYNGPLGLSLWQQNIFPNYRIHRCGAFAKPIGSDRLNSGGSYYGIMDLSNNAFELVVSLQNLGFTNIYGNGNVSDALSWGTNFLQKGMHDIGGTIRVGVVSDNAKVMDVSPNGYNTLIGIRGVIR